MSILLTFVLTTVISMAVAVTITRWSLSRERRVTAHVLAETMNRLRREFIAQNLASHGEEGLEDVYHRMMDVQDHLQTVIMAVRKNKGMIDGLLGVLDLAWWDTPNLGLHSKEYLKVVSEKSAVDNRSGLQRAYDRDCYGQRLKPTD